MWYRTAQQVNIFGLPLTAKPTSRPKFKQFQSDETGMEEIADVENDLDTPTDDNGVEIIEPENIEPETEITIDDPTPEDPFTPQDLETKIEEIDNDPTFGLVLPPGDDYREGGLHERCRCKIFTLPILSQVGVNDGRRIWRHSDTACETCKATAKYFNQKEIERLISKGIDINPVA